MLERPRRVLGQRLLEPRQRDHRGHPEHVAEHRGLLEQVALLVLERRDPRLDRLLDRDRQLGIGGLVGIEPPHRARRVDRPVVHEQPHELLEERRVAAGHLDGGLRGVVGDVATRATADCGTSARRRRARGCADRSACDRSRPRPSRRCARASPAAPPRGSRSASRRGSPRDRAIIASVSSSAHCRSSSTSTSGLCAASSSTNRRSAVRASSPCCFGDSRSPRARTASAGTRARRTRRGSTASRRPDPTPSRS